MSHLNFQPTLPCLVMLALATSFTTGAHAVEHPPRLTPEGGPSLPLSAQAARVDLLGAIDLYSVAIYAPVPTGDRPALISAETSKALRIEITYEDDLRRRVAIDWRRELVPQLEAAATSILAGAFRALRHRDVVLVEYVSSKGTAVRINNRVAVSGAGHDLMLAFLDHWLGQRPVSDEMKRVLERGGNSVASVIHAEKHWAPLSVEGRGHGR